jgi:uncharacterized protein
MLIRDATADDFAQILQLNEASVQYLSPLTAARLQTLHEQSSYHRVVDSNGEIAGFLLAFCENTAYDSSNYQWFDKHFKQFLYIDRVVVAKNFQGQGIGNKLYDDIFAFARNTQATQITCEFDIDPPNEISRRFHARYGFSEVGQRVYGADNKRVSLQSVSVDAVSASAAKGISA